MLEILKTMMMETFKTVRGILEKECGAVSILMFLTLLISDFTRQKTCIHACDKKWDK